jgi:hypothetical protein
VIKISFASFIYLAGKYDLSITLNLDGLKTISTTKNHLALEKL